jgi:hypothetical protein
MFKPNQPVMTSGFAGSVVRMYSEGMVEVRLASGICCVPVGDVRVLRIGKPEAKHLYRLTCSRGADMADWSNNFPVEVDANNSTQACAIAKRAGFYAGDCNMIG